jgi:hypothetical protein
MLTFSTSCALRQDSRPPRKDAFKPTEARSQYRVCHEFFIFVVDRRSEACSRDAGVGRGIFRTNQRLAIGDAAMLGSRRACELEYDF